MRGLYLLVIVVVFFFIFSAQAMCVAAAYIFASFVLFVVPLSWLKLCSFFWLAGKNIKCTEGIFNFKWFIAALRDVRASDLCIHIYIKCHQLPSELLIKLNLPLINHVHHNSKMVFSCYILQNLLSVSVCAQHEYSYIFKKKT